MKTMEIKKIILQVAGKEISLSIEEAKELQELLNSTFENWISYPSFPHVIHGWDWNWRGPIWTSISNADTVTLSSTGADLNNVSL